MFTTRWAMSYLRGPLTREQIATLMASRRAAAPRRAAGCSPAAWAPPAAGAHRRPRPPARRAADDATPVMPEVAGGIPVRWADIAAPWLATVGADPRGTVRAAAIVARVALRYDDDKADLVHDEEYEAVLFPISPSSSTSARRVAVDYDDRDLRTDVPPPAARTASPTRRSTPRRSGRGVERDLVDHLVRVAHRGAARQQEAQAVQPSGRDARRRSPSAAPPQPMTSATPRRPSCATSTRRRSTSCRPTCRRPTTRRSCCKRSRRGRQSEEILSTAGSMLGGLFGGRKSRKGVLGSVLGSAGQRRRPSVTHGRGRRSPRCAGEQDPAAARSARGPGAADGRRRAGDRHQVGRRRCGHRHVVGPAGAQRRQRHPARAGLVAGHADCSGASRAFVGRQGRGADVGVEPLVRAGPRRSTCRAPA